MVTLNATDVRKGWSSVVDDVIHDKPQFIKRTRDKMWLSNLSVMEEILDGYTFTANRFVEEDGSVTLSLNEIDLIENGATEAEARNKLAEAIMEYAVEFYNEYALYSRSNNRKGHIPYIFKALIMDDVEKIGEGILCRDGKN